MMLVEGPKSFYALRFLLGAAEAGFFPGVIFYLKSWFPAQARARTVARFMTAAPLSGVIGGPVSGALLGMHLTTLAGWQWMFLMEALPAVVLGVVALVYLVDRPEDARWLAGEEREWLLGALRREREESVAVVDRGRSHPLAENARRVGRPPGAFGALKMGQVWMLAGVYFGLNTVSYGVGLWLPKILQSVWAGSTLGIGFLTAIPSVAAALAMVVVGWHSDRSGERRWHTAVPALTGAVALAAAAFSTSIGPTIVLISVTVLCVFSMMGPFWAQPTSLLSGVAAAAGIAFINSIGNLGGFAGSYVIGLVRTSTGSFKGGLLLVSGALAVAGAVVLMVRTRVEKTATVDASGNLEKYENSG
jgi:ACS family tartrate transporter-like MFS transporter